jgi:hypothetical protein
LFKDLLGRRAWLRPGQCQYYRDTPYQSHTHTPHCPALWCIELAIFTVQMTQPQAVPISNYALRYFAGMRKTNGLG